MAVDGTQDSGLAAFLRRLRDPVRSYPRGDRIRRDADNQLPPRTARSTAPQDRSPWILGQYSISCFLILTAISISIVVASHQRLQHCLPKSLLREIVLIVFDDLICSANSWFMDHIVKIALILFELGKIRCLPVWLCHDGKVITNPHMGCICGKAMLASLLSLSYQPYIEEKKNKRRVDRCLLTIVRNRSWHKN